MTQPMTHVRSARGRWGATATAAAGALLAAVQILAPWAEAADNVKVTIVNNVPGQSLRITGLSLGGATMDEERCQGGAASGQSWSCQFTLAPSGGAAGTEFVLTGFTADGGVGYYGTVCVVDAGNGQVTASAENCRHPLWHAAVVDPASLPAGSAAVGGKTGEAIYQFTITAGPLPPKSRLSVPKTRAPLSGGIPRPTPLSP